jgi:hypothetical protein
VKLVAVAVALGATTARAGARSVAARAGWQYVYLEGDGEPADLRGYVAAVDATYALGDRVAVGETVEASLYTQRSDRLPPGPSASALATYLELQVDTNPRGSVAARIDLGTGFRWLALPLAAGPTDHFRAWEPLRLRVGPAWRTRGVEVAAMVSFGFGWLVGRARDGVCPVTGSCSDSLYDSDTQSSAHFVTELSLSVRGWP